MKWLGATMNTLVVLILTSILAAYLQPIVRSISPERSIKARIDLNMWMEKPTKTGYTEQKPSDDKDVNEAFHTVFMSPDYYHFMAMDLLNDTEKTVTDVRVRLEDNQRPDILIVTDDGRKRWFVTGLNDIKLPDMKPGDKTKVYMWASSSFARILMPDVLSTFSSVGPFDITFSSPKETEYYEKPNLFFDTIDAWAGWVGVISAILLIIVGFAGLQISSNYYKKLLADDMFYADEKARYDQEPTKFAPKF